MKLFGRKTLALLLALTMMLSLCSFTAFAGNEDQSGSTTESGTGGGTGTGTGTGEGTGGTGTGETPPAQKTLQSVALKSDETAPVVGFGTTEAEVKTKLAALKFTYTYSSGEPEEKTISSWSCTTTGGYKATVPGEYSFVGSVDNVKSEAITVTVNKGAATAVDYSKTVSVENAPDMTGDKAVESMPKTFSATVNGTTYNNLAVSNYYGAWEHPGATGVLKPDIDYTYTAAPNTDAALTDLPNLSVTLTVKPKTVSNVEPQTVYFWEGRSSELSSSRINININEVDLSSPIRRALEENSKNNITFEISFSSKLTYGSVRSGVWSIDEWPSSASDNNTLTVEVPFTAIGTGTANKDLQYSGKVKISVERLINHITAKMENSTSTESFFRTRVADAIESIAKNLSGSKYYVVFDTIGSDGGTLYLTSSKDNVADEGEAYSRSDLQKMYYESNYDGEKFELDYSVYDDKDANKYDRIFSGSVVIENPQILNVKVSITKDDVYNFSSQELQDALSELDSDWTLDHIKLNSISANGGKLYYDYDDSKTLSKNEQARQGEYYVEPSKRQKSIDLITYVPREKSSSRSYTAEFGFEVWYKDARNRDKHIDGMLVITVQEPADITISASANGYATLDVQDFINFLQDKKGSNTTLKYVTFNGLPNSKTNGYMYDGYSTSYYSKQDRISSPDNGKYYDDDAYPSNSKKNDYKLEDLTWVVGKTNKVSAEFTIRYTSGSSKTEKSLTGTIDFVIDGGSVSGNTKKVDLLASQTYSNFYYDLINSNVASVRFVSVTGGKLIYRDVSSQTPITPGTDVYYLSSTGYLAGRKMLSNVVFLPGYNQTSATITLKAFDAKDKSANAQYIFTIKPVTTSSFSDMSNYSSYAGSVGLMTNLGIINGVGNNKFNPTGSVTRGEWITMLYRAAGSPAVYSSVSFTDVPSWCKDAVQWAVQNGITDGIGNNKFGPDMTLDRMQIVTFMYRFAKLQGMDVSSTLYLSAYTDGNTVDAWAQPAMKWALQKGYLDPVGGKIQPKGTMTRVLVADCLTRLLTK